MFDAGGVMKTLRGPLRLLPLVFMAAFAVRAFAQEGGVGGGGPELYRLALPGKDWALDVSLPDFEVGLEDLLLSGELGYGLFTTLRADDKSKSPMVLLRIRLEAAKIKGGDAELRDFAAKKLNKSDGVTGVKFFEYKQVPGVRYSMENQARFLYFPNSAPPGPSARGVEAYMARDDVWITFSVLSFSRAKLDERLLHSVLDSAKFADTSTPSTSFDHYYKAQSLIHRKQFTQAAAHLGAALALEQKQRRLATGHWRNLIGQMLDVYAASKDEGRAKELLDYGVKLDPTFPQFHLRLAQHYASLDDVDKVIDSLRTAHLHRQADRRLAFWFDPLKHPAFERFKTNEKFRRAVKAMKY